MPQTKPITRHAKRNSPRQHGAGKCRIALATSRSINQLGKVAAIQSAQGQATQLGYDANGEPISSTDPLGHSTRQTLDGLRRPIATTLPDNSNASQAWNQLNQLTVVTDPKGVATSYTRNAFGDVLAETSPDSGTTRFVRDTTGLITSKTDARGQTTRYQHDLLGRVLQATHADGKTEHYRYDAPGQVGYLSELEDAGAITRYQRDLKGRVTSTTQNVKDNPALPSSYRVQYAYSGGQLSAVTYPSGLKTLYRRNPSGQITGIDVQPPGLTASAKPFITDLTHTALGQPKSWRWTHCTSTTPSCDNAQRVFDADGRLTQSEIASYQYDAAGRISGLSQQLWSRASDSTNGNAGNANTTPSPRTFSWRIAYDSRSRIASFDRTAPGSARSRYSWDANSNRLTSIETTATAEVDLQPQLGNPFQVSQASQATRIEPTSNRLLGFSQTLTTTQGGTTQASSTAQVNYTLDAAGNLTSDGLREFAIDASGRIASTSIGKHADLAKVNYLHNALGQRVFKSEPVGNGTPPNEAQLGSSFVNWLRINFGWLYSGQSGTTAQLGQAFVYDEQGSLLAEYSNGGSQSQGALELIWLPSQTGENIPVGLYKNGRLYAIHADHLGTPRLITDDANKPVWQWPYSAWGTVGPSGVLKATGGATGTPNASANARATTATVERLERTEPGITLNLRFPGQYFDSESGLFYNYFRSYQPGQGRYTQSDPIGLEGGWSRFGYVDGSPLMATDPMGLQTLIYHGIPGFALPNRNPVMPGTRLLDPDDRFGPTYTPGFKLPDFVLPPFLSIPLAIIQMCATNTDYWDGLKPYRGRTKTNGESGKKRRYYEWDYTHGDVEVYDGRGNHQGSANPATGEITKPPVPGRKINI